MTLCLLGLFHQHAVSSALFCSLNFEPFGAFDSKINWFRNQRVNSQLEKTDLERVVSDTMVSFDTAMIIVVLLKMVETRAG